MNPQGRAQIDQHLWRCQNLDPLCLRNLRQNLNQEVVRVSHEVANQVVSRVVPTQYNHQAEEVR